MTPNPAHRTELDNPGPTPRLLLADHHCAIEAACADLRVAAYIDDTAELVASYRTFEHAVAEHIAVEEEEILPGYEAYAPEDAETIRKHHAELRKQLFSLGVDVELHSIRLGQLEHLIETIRAHAAHEDLGMYAWAQANLPLRGRREMFVRLGQSLRVLSRERSRRSATGRP